MRGKVYLIKRGIGKIIFGKKESTVISMPINFEQEDIVDATLRENDLNKQPLHMVAYSKDTYYGFIAQKFNPNRGVLVATYPQMLGTVLFEGSFKVGDKVCFRVKKELEKFEAIDIKLLKKSSYKATNPIFTKLEEKILKPKEGFVKDIVKTTKPKGGIKGTIKRLFRSRKYGFIKADGIDIYFSFYKYVEFFKNEPSLGEEVSFTYFENQKGFSVGKFYIEKELKNPYGILDNGATFLLKEYEKSYNKDPQIGDIVEYVDEDGKITFTNSAKQIFYLKKESKQKSIKAEVKYINFEKNFGFLRSEDGDIHFPIKMYQSIYKKIPKKGDKIDVITKTTDRGVSVKEFVSAKITAQTKSFKNFSTIQKDALYYAYVDKNEAKEIYRYNPKNLNQSISLYLSNDKSIDKRYRLLAIECMLENGYINKKISKQKLISQQQELLIQLSKQEPHNLEYQLKLQKLNYNPLDIKPKDGKKIAFISKKEIRDYVVDSLKFDFIEPVLELKEIKNTQEKITFIDKVDIKKYKPINKPWNIKEIANDR